MKYLARCLGLILVCLPLLPAGAAELPLQALTLHMPACTGASLTVALHLGKREYTKYQMPDGNSGLDTLEWLDFTGDGRCDLVFVYFTRKRTGFMHTHLYPPLVDFYRQTTTDRFVRVPGSGAKGAIRYNIGYILNRTGPLHMDADVFPGWEVFPGWKQNVNYANLNTHHPIGSARSLAIPKGYQGQGWLYVLPVYPRRGGTPYLVAGDDKVGGVHVYRWNGQAITRLPDTDPYARAALRLVSQRLVETGRKYLEAARYPGASNTFVSATHVDPSNPQAYYWRGLTNYLAGVYRAGAGSQGAYHWFEEAIRQGLSGQDLNHAYYDLGLSYEAIYEAPKAMAAYRQYLKRDPQGRFAAEARQRLINLAHNIFITPAVNQKMYADSEQAHALVGALGGSLKAADQAQLAAAPSSSAGPVPAVQISTKELEALDRAIVAEAKRQGKVIPEAERNWMVAYKAVFPKTSLADLVAHPDKYKKLPWVQSWIKAYQSLPGNASPRPAPTPRLEPYSAH